MINAEEKLPRITLITPIYNEALGLENYKNAVTKTLFSVKDKYFEVIFIDDGSTDNSWEIIESICKEAPDRFQALRLSRNFGAHIADSAGVHHAKGDAVISLACDLQDPLETVLAFVEKWQKGAKIVWGKRRQRIDKQWRKWTSNLFFLFLKNAMPKNSKFCTGGFILIDREVVECIKLFKEQNRLNFVLAAWTGFDQEVVEYNRQARLSGESRWSLGQLIKTSADALLAFSNLPARVVTTLGIVIGLASIAFAVFLMISYLLFNVLPGWTSVMLLISSMFGMVFLVLGVAMEYLRRIHVEVTNRPLYFVSKKVNVLEGN